MKTILLFLLLACNAVGQTNGSGYITFSNSAGIRFSQWTNHNLVEFERTKTNQKEFVIRFRGGQEITMSMTNAVQTYMVTNISKEYVMVPIPDKPGERAIAWNGKTPEKLDMNQRIVTTQIIRREVLTFTWRQPFSVTNDTVISETKRTMVKREDWVEK